MQVLVVEDSAVYRKLIGDHLRSWGFAFTLAETGSEAWQVLQQPKPPKLVLLDWVLPDIEGIELCRRIRTGGLSGQYTYIILLTGKEGHQSMLDALQAGADDYLSKPFDDSELQARLLVGKRILNLQEELVAARESMREAATRDSLTGLFNRAEIFGMLERELERGRRERKPVSVVLSDIDHFKNVNDSQGHLFGDEALREIARRLQAKLRPYDGVGRYGGEEFLLVLPNCDLEGAMMRANELREAIAQSSVVFKGVKKSITMSMGVAVSECVGVKELERLVSRADTALYAAKDKGRNRVEHLVVCSQKRPLPKTGRKEELPKG
ncbi:MAG: diguanylate cyclase [Terriglobales bacterium]|jgi:diguanylate cyclase (GGDEF)-like protein